MTKTNSRKFGMVKRTLLGIPKNAKYVILRSVDGGEFKEFRWFSSESNAWQWLGRNSSVVGIKPINVTLDGYTIIRGGHTIVYRVRKI